MLAPIAVSVAYAILGPAARGAPLTISILLGLAYGASIGGIATPVGTPTNLIVIGYLEEQVGVKAPGREKMKSKPREYSGAAAPLSLTHSRRNAQ